MILVFKKPQFCQISHFSEKKANAKKSITLKSIQGEKLVNLYLADHL